MSRAYFRGKQYEQLFMELTGATPRRPDQSDRDHIDCNLSGRTVDVKGMRRSHRNGFVLVEFTNVEGKTGWCHPDSGAELLAFLFDEGFYVVCMMDLYEASKALVTKHNGNTKVLRENGVRAKDGLYKLVGRTPYKGTDRKDVFTYITKRDLLSIGHTLYELE